MWYAAVIIVLGLAFPRVMSVLGGMVLGCLAGAAAWFFAAYSTAWAFNVQCFVGFSVTGAVVGLVAGLVCK